MKKGIDISEWQTGIDYTTLSKQIDFVVLREGYRQAKDKMFDTHVAAFKALNFPIIGVYHFIYALNAEQAKQEAESCIRNVESVGLPKTTRIWCDFEYDTVTNARKHGIILRSAECNEFSKIFCETVKAAGYPTGIYTNEDYAQTMYSEEMLSAYPVWYAWYSETQPKRECMLWQYSSKGRLDGFSEDLDMDYLMEEETQEDIIDDGGDAVVTAQTILDIARSWLGCNEYDGSHKPIIDLYNSHTPLARSYKVQYTDQWCDTCLSAMFIKADAVDLIGGTECGVEEHVKKFQAAGIWIEDGTITPQVGDIIVYNWDTASQPNNGYSDHIGIVEMVGAKGIVTIEGNYHDAVSRRTIPVGYGYVRGYARPKYGMVDEIVIEEPDITPIQDDTDTNTEEGDKYMFETETVKNGSTGASVKLLQTLLKGLGYYGSNGKVLAIDGDAGTNTVYALKNYQSKAGLSSDGICGPLTWAKILGL